MRGMLHAIGITLILFGITESARAQENTRSGREAPIQLEVRETRSPVDTLHCGPWMPRPKRPAPKERPWRQPEGQRPNPDPGIVATLDSTCAFILQHTPSEVDPGMVHPPRMEDDSLRGRP